MKRNILSIIAIALLAIIGCSNGKINMDAIPSPLARFIPAQAQHTANAATDFGAAVTLSENDEPDLGQTVGLALTNRYKLVETPVLLKYVSLVGIAVGSTSLKPGLRFNFGILDTNDINAYSGPAGYIFITGAPWQTCGMKPNWPVCWPMKNRM